MQDFAARNFSLTVMRAPLATVVDENRYSVSTSVVCVTKKPKYIECAMPPTIRIDDEVYARLQSLGRAFEDTPNSVLRRVLELENASQLQRQGREDRARLTRAHDKTPQHLFRAPLLRVLKENGGQLHRLEALKQIKELLADRLTEYDKADISSGTVRWEKSAEWEVRAMRIEGLLKPAQEGPWGVWMLTKKGLEAATSQ